MYPAWETGIRYLIKLNFGNEPGKHLILGKLYAPETFKLIPCLFESESRSEISLWPHHGLAAASTIGDTYTLELWAL